MDKLSKRYQHDEYDREWESEEQNEWAYENDGWANENYPTNFSAEDYEREALPREYILSQNAKQKKKTLSLWSTILILLFVIVTLGGIGGVSYYLFNNYFNTNSKEEKKDEKGIYSENINNQTVTEIQKTYKKYLNVDNEEQKAGISYLYQRSLSIQFQLSGIIKGEAGSLAASGTGWIFNKIKNKHIYYIATNLHVVAPLSYLGYGFFENKPVRNGNGTIEYKREYSDWRRISLTATYVGFLDETSFKKETNYNINTNLNFVQVENPKVIFANIDTVSNRRGEYYYTDFAILRFDFSNFFNTISLANSTLRQFTNWLIAYNQNPTSFATTPVDDQKFLNYRYYIGGFPATKNKKTSRLNISETQWIAFSNVPIIVAENKPLVTSYNLPKKDYENFLQRLENTPNNISYLKDGWFYQNLKNTALKGLVDINSLPGASGSAVVTKIDGKFQVIGIYWGAYIVSDNNIIDTLTNQKNQLYEIGVFDFLNVNNQAGQYNIFQTALEQIKKSDNDPVLEYNPVFKQQLILN